MTTRASSLPGSPGIAGTPSNPGAAPALWSFVADATAPQRRRTREVRVGDIGIGASNPIRVQSMTIADTLDTAAVVDEIEQLHGAGSEIVRVTAPNRGAAENLGEIRRRLRARNVRVPLVADIHFTPQAALIAAEHVEKVRVNPGNYADRKHFKQWEYSDTEYADELARLDEAFSPLVRRCKELGVAMRIGTNHGSLSDRILNRYGDTPLGMVESALEFVRICERQGYHDLVLSMKASDVKVMVQAYRLLAARMTALGMEYPFHLGVTEAGAGFTARVKSTAGIAALLQDGIGDTVRVSLTEDSIYEIPVARALAALVAPAAAPAALTAAPLPVDPYRFERRAIVGVGVGPARLGLEHPPRIERVATPPAAPFADAAAAAAWLWSVVDATRTGVDFVLVRADHPGVDTGEVRRAWAEELARRPRDARTAVGFELRPSTLHAEPRHPLWAAAARLSLRIEAEEAGAFTLPAGSAPAALQYTLFAAHATALPAAAGVLARRIAAGALPFGALALDTGMGTGVAGRLHMWRAAVAEVGTLRMPLVLRAAVAPGAAVDAQVSVAELHCIATLGGLAVDGLGDALQIDTGNAERDHELAAEILQATRLRLSKADFIACPSCGRTQFDLQTTTARITARLGHLKGLKIAVMGCIVNGPGEMADADFGYVGSGADKIDLYHGKDRVARGVPQEDAVDRLVELTRGQGRWEEPAAGAGTP